jgi:hypothetical protein
VDVKLRSVENNLGYTVSHCRGSAWPVGTHGMSNPHAQGSRDAAHCTAASASSVPGARVEVTISSGAAVAMIDCMPGSQGKARMVVLGDFS